MSLKNHDMAMLIPNNLNKSVYNRTTTIILHTEENVPRNR